MMSWGGAGRGRVRWGLAREGLGRFDTAGLGRIGLERRSKG